MIGPAAGTSGRKMRRFAHNGGVTSTAAAPGGATGPNPEVQVFTARLTGRPLLDSDGRSLGRIRDVVIWPVAGVEPPRALGGQSDACGQFAGVGEPAEPGGEQPVQCAVGRRPAAEQVGEGLRGDEGSLRPADWHCHDNANDARSRDVVTPV